MVDQPDGERDPILRWVFRRVFGRRPRGEELADYARAIDECDRLGLDNALPIFNQLRQSHGAVAPLPVNPAEWESPRANGARAHPEIAPPQPEAPRTDLANMAKSAPASTGSPVVSDFAKVAKSENGPPTSNGRLRAPQRAEALVREQLANGPVPGDLVIAAAAEAAISERFLVAAAERLGVRARRGQWWLPG